MIPKIGECGLNLIKGLWEGISGAAGWLYEKISGFCSGVVDKVKGFFGVHSPSRVFAEIGEYLDAGLAEGIEDNADMALDAMTALSDGVANSFDPDLTGYSYGNNSTNYLAGRGVGSTNSGGVGGGNNITQNNYFTAPEMTAYEQQVQIKRLERDLVGGLS